MERLQSTPYPRGLTSVVRTVAALAGIYWHPHCFPKDFERAQRDWLTALVQFITAYAYERQGAPSAYRTLANDALVSVGSEFSRPGARFASRVWMEFRDRARKTDLSVNAKVNPLNDEGAANNVSAPRFVATLARFQHNILRWSKAMIERGDAENALSRLQTIRGIGPKIAAFYLRDVARFFELEERPGWCFQPIDVWTRRTASYWGELLDRRVHRDRDAAHLLADLAVAAGVRGSDLNVGSWILGSQLTNGDLRAVVTSPAGLARCLVRNLRWSAAIVQIVEPLVSELSTDAGAAATP